MDELPDITTSEAFKRMRDAGLIPLGVISYDMTAGEFKISIIRGQDTSEVNALLAKLGLKGQF